MEARDRSEGDLGPIDLSVARELRVTLPAGEALAEHRLLLRLQDADGRPLGSLPFLDLPAPVPESHDGDAFP
jgi:hypothetical protein